MHSLRSEKLHLQSVLDEKMMQIDLFQEDAERSVDIELKKENDFLHLRLQHVSKENDKLTRYKD
jgi:UPF0288 family protein (methanogenesis marker protein 3)